MLLVVQDVRQSLSVDMKAIITCKELTLTRLEARTRG